MKKIITVLVFAALAFPVFAQSDAQDLTEPGKNEMNRIINRMNSLTNIAESYGQLSGQFKRIATSEPQSWTPRYFQAYSLTMQAFYTTDTSLVDSILTVSNNAIDVERSYQVLQMDEIYILRALNQCIWLRKNPSIRFKNASTAITKLFSQSDKINPNNPRAAFVRAYFKFVTPENLGGGKKNAAKGFKDAGSIFANYQAPDTKEILPTWGQKITNEMITFCNN